MQKFDIAIIGSGPFGYSAATKLGNAGLSVCIIEKHNLGGTCLNKGCIPAKTLNFAVKKFGEKDLLSTYGIETKSQNFNFNTFKNKQNEIIDRLRKGLEFSFKKANVKVIKGTAYISKNNSIIIKQEKEELEIEYKKLLIGIGTEAKIPNIFKNIKTYTGESFWDLKEIPKNVLIVGGGAIGCEYAFNLAKLGINVSILEVLDRLLISEELEISQNILNDLKKSNVKVYLKENIEYVKEIDNKFIVKISNQEIETDLIILACGRFINFEGLGLENLGIDTNIFPKKIEDLKIKENVWIGGDIASGPQLAHKAYYDADIVCQKILENKQITPDYTHIPISIFTIPETGRIGLTEQVAKDNFNIKVVKSNFASIGKAVVESNTRGFIKFIINKENDQILGISMYGKGSTELINIGLAIIKNKMKIQELKNLYFSHPTLSEIFRVEN